MYKETLTTMMATHLGGDVPRTMVAQSHTSESPQEMLQELIEIGFEKDSLPEYLGGTWSQSNFTKWFESRMHPDQDLGQALTKSSITKDQDSALETKHPVATVKQEPQESVPDHVRPVAPPDPEKFDIMWDAELWEETPEERRERKRIRDATYSRNRRKKIKETKVAVGTEHDEVRRKNIALKNENQRLRDLFAGAESLVQQHENPLHLAPAAAAPSTILALRPSHGPIPGHHNAFAAANPSAVLQHVQARQYVANLEDLLLRSQYVPTGTTSASVLSRNDVQRMIDRLSVPDNAPP
jgi:hypothetical protein